MNQAQALSRARKLLGPKAAIHVRKNVPVGAERLAEIERRRAITAELELLVSARDARRMAVLNADAEYQRLRSEAARIEKERDSLHAGYHHRVEVVINHGISYHVEAAGDNFAEALAALAALAAKTAGSAS